MAETGTSGMSRHWQGRLSTEKVMRCQHIFYKLAPQPMVL